MDNFLNPFNKGSYKINLKSGELSKINNDSENTISNSETGNQILKCSYEIFLHENLSTNDLHYLVNEGFIHNSKSSVVFTDIHYFLDVISSSSFSLIYILYTEKFEEKVLTYEDKKIILCSISNIKQTYERTIIC